MEERRGWHHGGTREGMEKERVDGCEGVERRDGGLGRRTGGLATDSSDASPSERYKTITSSQVLIRSLQVTIKTNLLAEHKARTPRKVFGFTFDVSFSSAMFLFS